MSQANLEWIQKEWVKWTQTDLANRISPSGFFKVGVEHVAKLFAAHCMEALASHAPSEAAAQPTGCPTCKKYGVLATGNCIDPWHQAEIEHNDHQGREEPMNDWHPISSAPIGIEVETKIDDGRGIRNIQYLKLIGNLWYFPDGSMYVYYQPTHWREIQH